MLSTLYTGSQIFMHRWETRGIENAAAVSDYDRVRNIPFHHSRQLDPLFTPPFPILFSVSIDLYDAVGLEMYRALYI